MPTVEYPLWPATIELLKEFRSDDPTWVLVNEDGKRLWSETKKDDGKVAKIDNIKSAYCRLLTRLRTKKILTTRKTFKILRKTSPSLLEQSPKFSHVARHFLGQSPKGVTDKHYVTPDQSTPNDAIEWLGKQYEVETLSD